jgi:hypothetical protein
MYQKSMREALQEARDYRDTSDIEEVKSIGLGPYQSGKAIAKKMMKYQSMKAFASQVAKIKTVTRADLEKILPDYVGGKVITTILGEEVELEEGNLSYDEWLKQVKGIEKGAHGINSDEHAKYSKEWKSYATASESKLTEIVGGHGEMTVTKDGGVMIIKTKDWQTYKAKGWAKKTNESLDLTATGDTTTSNASQEVEGEELNEKWNEKVSLKGLAEFRAMYKTWLKSGVDKRFIQSMEKLYDDMVIGGMYSSRSAEMYGILKIDGKTKYKNANW